jgi:hypothetical protein
LKTPEGEFRIVKKRPEGAFKGVYFTYNCDGIKYNVFKVRKELKGVFSLYAILSSDDKKGIKINEI